MIYSPFAHRTFGPAPTHGRPCAVVIHGFTGAPSDVWPVASALGTAGFATAVPCLTGHDQGVEGIRDATLKDWCEDVRSAAQRLCDATGQPVYVAGLSLGSLLALDLALSETVPVAGVAALAPPLVLGSAGRLASALVHRTPQLRHLTMPKLKGPDIENGAPLPGAPGMPLLAVHQLYRLMDRVKAGLGEYHKPLLVLHSQQDHTAPILGGYTLAAAVRATPLRLVVLERGFHVITRDVLSTRVANEVVAFAERTCRPDEDGLSARV